MQVVGGVEIMMMDEQKAYNKNGLVYLHIFPFLMPHPRLISEDEPLYIGVNCDGERIGITDREGLLLALGQLNSAGLLEYYHPSYNGIRSCISWAASKGSWEAKRTFLVTR